MAMIRKIRIRKPETVKAASTVHNLVPCHGFMASKFIPISAEGEDDRGEENVDERDLEEEDPAEPHQLIVAEARQRPAHPDEDEEQGGDFGEEDGDVEETAENPRQPPDHR